ncbi:MAG: DNA metabolism protein [Eubacteriales Family XIII. Incertae Sedis bacterium]|nr:MAG: DNA metabolism protein [Clostridiales Family XIII bacterium]
MAEYLYDGTFEGFLCCVYAHYYNEKATAITVKGDAEQIAFFGELAEIKTDGKKAQIVYRAIENKISAFDLKRAYRIFLAEAPDKEMILLNYLCFGFIKGQAASSYHGLPIVRDAELLEKRVTTEANRFRELLRFSVLKNDILYSEIEPDNNILELLGPHYSDRYKNDPFIIHDVKRSRALIAAGGRWYISEFTKENLPEYHEDESSFRSLWKNYFETIAIKERTNPRCQKNFMPVRYWKHLTEMK